MRNYSIMPLNVDYIDEICDDIKEQYETGISTCALFKMALVPEGNPVIDKASIMCEEYDLFRDRLAGMGIECGILVQATIGHGYKLNQDSSFVKYIRYTDGVEESICCPYDEDFKKHFYEQFQILAKHKPKMIMIDDDFRLMHRNGVGCACSLHLHRINELTGKSYTREELYREIEGGNEELFKVFYETQREALVEAAKAMRAGIDSVDETIPGSICVCGDDTEFGGEIGRIMAGKDNPVTIRINNARYTSNGAREFTPVMYRAAAPIRILKQDVDYILAETDTCPQNRYSTSASNLHSHFTASILEGCNGAKQWITRMIDYEPESGRAYRDILSKYFGFYNKLEEITPNLIWQGARIPVPDKPLACIGWDKKSQNGWHDHVLERFGIPFYFAFENTGATFLDGDDDEIYTDREILEILGGEVFCSAETAQKLIKRGFGKYLGINIREWNGKRTSGEFILNNNKVCATQIGIKELVIENENVKAESLVYHLRDGKYRDVLFPGVTSFKNELGGNIMVFSGTPRTNYTYYEAFSFLNESRKQQLISLLQKGNNIPVWYVGDAEICLRTAEIKDSDEQFCVIYNIGLDVLPKITLKTAFDISGILRLNCKGDFEEVSFVNVEKGIELDINVNILEPVVLKFRRAVS